MINPRILFGWIPKTAEYESSQEALRKEYKELTAFMHSKELADYLELEKEVLSSEFALRKKTISGSRYSDTPEYKKEREYLRLKKSREMIRYYKLKDSVELKDFLEFDRSYDIKHFHTLESFVGSDEYLQKKNELGRRKFRNSPEYQKFLEYRALKKSDRIKKYFAFKTSDNYVNFTLLIGSEKIAAYEQLEKFIRSDEFKKVKEYMILPGRKKLEMSEEYKREQKYLEMKKSDRFRWYFSTRNSKKFDEIKRWELTFSDEFESRQLDKKKWLTRYFWGEALLHESYVNEAEKQFFPDDQNIQVDNSILKIITRKQNISGKKWNPAIGFYQHDFKYTAGIINSGGRFRQQYGLFEAKIRFNLNHPVNHAFWMLSDLMIPHIDIARAAAKIRVGSYFGNPNVKGGIDKRAASLGRNRYGSDFQIFSLEWAKEKLTWKINGVKIYSTSQGIPQMPMYINLSSSLYEEVNGSLLPAELDVDWVRCYKQA
jgi:beta-glucanase (GH16 family)